MEQVAARQEKEKLLNQLRVLFQVMPSGVIILDEKGCVEVCNPVAQQLLGETLLGRPWIDIVQTAFLPRADDGHEISLRDGKRIALATASLRPESGQLLVLTDFTETRLLQARLNQQQRLSDLGQMMAELAHQIRTPLSSALIYASHLKTTSLTPIQQQDFSDKLLGQLHFIERQIKDMLQFVRGEQSNVEIIAISKLLDDLYQSIETQLTATGAHWICENQVGALRLICQREALLGAFQNIINNALEAAHEKPSLKFSVVLVDEKNVDFVVADNGPGMTDDVKAQVLKPFFTTRAQGTGLGLAIAQAVAKAHQGELWLESTVNCGTRVGIRLPVIYQRSVA